MWKDNSARRRSEPLAAEMEFMGNRLIRRLEHVLTLNDDDLDRLAEISTPSRDVPAKQDLIREGDNPGTVRLILDGFAYRYKTLPSGERQILGYLIPGDFCDLHIAILGRMDHSIATFGPCTIVEIPRRTILELTNDHERIALGFWWATLVDEAILREWLVGLGVRSAGRRMAHLFCEILTRLEVVGLFENDRFRLPITQADLSETLGLSPVHTNRMLAELRVKGLLSKDGAEIIIHDLSGLKQYAEFEPDYLHLERLVLDDKHLATKKK